MEKKVSYLFLLYSTSVKNYMSSIKMTQKKIRKSKNKSKNKNVAIFFSFFMRFSIHDYSINQLLSGKIIGRIKVLSHL